MHNQTVKCSYGTEVHQEPLIWTMLFCTINCSPFDLFTLNKKLKRRMMPASAPCTDLWRWHFPRKTQQWNASTLVIWTVAISIHSYFQRQQTPAPNFDADRFECSKHVHTGSTQISDSEASDLNQHSSALFNDLFFRSSQQRKNSTQVVLLSDSRFLIHIDLHNNRQISNLYAQLPYSLVSPSNNLD
jgi:hypothetical protein